MLFAVRKMNAGINPSRRYRARVAAGSRSNRRTRPRQLRSPQLQRIPGTETVSPNGVIYGQVKLLGPDGNFYLKTNNQGFSSMTPDSWSLARAKGEMSQAWVNRTQVGNLWFGDSGGVKFQFHPPSNNVPGWRGYPIQTP